MNTRHNLRSVFKVLLLAEQCDLVLILQHAVESQEIWSASLLFFFSKVQFPEILLCAFWFLKILKLYSFSQICLLYFNFRQCQTWIVFVFYFSFCIFHFCHKLTLALIWIAENEKRKMTKIWPGHFMVWWCSLYSLSQWYCLFSYFQSVIFWALLWKTKLRSPHQIQPAWTVCEFVCLCVRVCFIRASINSNLFLVCLLLFLIFSFLYVTHQNKLNHKAGIWITEI